MDYNCIVLSGGAVKAIAILGCLQSLKDQKKLENVSKFIATSAGAIISYLLCIGYTPIEIMVDICIHDWIEKMANFDVIKAVNGMGAISFSTVAEMLERLTIEKIGRFITLGELHDKYKKLLICCTYNYSKQIVEFLDANSNPDLPCIVALRMSSNLPILFEPFLYDSSYYIDGGILCNFPLHKIDIEIDHVVAIKIKKNEKRESMDYKGKNFINFVHDLIFIPSIAYEDLINKQYEQYCDIIELDLEKYSCLHFNASKNDRLEIFSYGYNTGKNFIEKKK
jgi:predicted acylesterase/phospholipase RssA